MSNTQSSNDVKDKKDPNAKYYVAKLLHSSETMLTTNPFQEEIDQKLVIINSRYGKDLAKILGPVNDISSREEEDFFDIDRIATEDDENKYTELQEKEKEAVKICREKIKDHNLDMKLVSAHYLTDDSKVLFFFTAENRVDFRELVKDLVSVFRMRIELRQIGVRDESRVLGGLAVCGRNYCCNGITDRLNPVSIKMAKDQNLSLNSMKISGPCGRLLCCLSYEYLYYKEERDKMPSVGTTLTFNKEKYRVDEVNYITHKIMLSGSEHQKFVVSLDCMSRKKEGYWKLDRLPEELN